jgi:hypothetical protein
MNFGEFNFENLDKNFCTNFSKSNEYSNENPEIEVIIEETPHIKETTTEILNFNSFRDQNEEKINNFFTNDNKFIPNNNIQYQKNNKTKIQESFLINDEDSINIKEYEKKENEKIKIKYIHEIQERNEIIIKEINNDKITITKNGILGKKKLIFFFTQNKF